MALESGTYINSLNASNPASTDGLGQADDHIRLIKSTVKATLPNLDAPMTASEDDLNLLTGISGTTPTTGQIVQVGSGGTLEVVDAAAGVTAGLGLEFDTTNTEQLNVSEDCRVVDMIGHYGVLMGNSSGLNNYIKFDVGSIIRFHPGGSEKASLNSSGDFSAQGDVTAYSDARLKTDISEIVGALDTVYSMRGVNFTKIDTGRRGTGVIAQEVQKLVPEAVHEDDQGYLTVAYGNLVGVLIEAVKELADEVTVLKQVTGTATGDVSDVRGVTGRGGFNNWDYK
jgi:hypothetical protein